MHLPNYEELMEPLLETIADGKEITLNESVKRIIKKLNISYEAANIKMPRGNGTALKNRICWAKTYLSKSDLIEYVDKGIFKITPEGLRFLKEAKVISVNTLPMTPERQRLLKLRKEKNVNKREGTPEEILQESYNDLTKMLEDNLLKKLKNVNPDFFERLSVELLIKMGYGGLRKESGIVTPKRNDGGIDGIINDDRLGLEVIGIQAKRWKNIPVDRPKIQEFVGALQGQKINKGVIITTSYFSDGAVEYAKNINTKIVLIDGKALSELMVEFNVGIQTKEIYTLKEIDDDYFESE